MKSQRFMVFAIATAACGRVGFAPLIDGPPAGTGDATTRCDWSQGPTLGTTVFRSELSSSLGEFDPYLVPGDPLTITFNSDRGAIGTFNTYVAHRASLSATFGAPTLVAGLDTGQFVFSFNVLPGALRGYASLNEDLYEVSRTSPTDPVTFGRALTEINTATQEYDGFPAQDDLTLYWASGPVNSLDIYTATRPTTASPWGSKTALAINSPGDDSGPTLTSDGLVIVWQTNNDLYYSTRASIADPFTTPHVLLATTQVEFEPFVREDGCELFYVQGPDTSNVDLFSVEIR